MQITCRRSLPCGVGDIKKFLEGLKRTSEFFHQQRLLIRITLRDDLGFLIFDLHFAYRSIFMHLRFIYKFSLHLHPAFAYGLQWHPICLACRFNNLIV